MIIDAHAHIVPQVCGRIGGGATRALPYGKVQIGDAAPIRLLPPLCAETSFSAEALLENMDWAGVDKAVLLQGPFYGDHNQSVAQAARQWPDRFIGAGFLDPRSPDARQNFKRIVDELNFRIIKLEWSEATGWCGLYPDLQLAENGLSWLWREAETRGVVITLDLGAVGSASYQTQGVRDILERHPNLKIVIAHLAQPPINRAPDAEVHRLWEEQVLLAQHRNVWFDLAALPFYVPHEEFPFASVQSVIQKAVQMVGAEKLMWGTDAPALLCHAAYPQLLSVVSRHCDFLSPAEMQKILGGNAEHVYGQCS